MGLMRATFRNPTDGTEVAIDIASDEDVSRLIDDALSFQSQRGHPAFELCRDDGSTLSFSTDGERVCLNWTNSLGDSRHGDGATEPLVFDYFGSWSEASAEWLIPMESARKCVQEFMAHGIPETPQVLFQAD
jgi:hypothetical protein